MDVGGIIIGLVGGFVLSIIANIFTDPVRNWLAERSLISKNKRVEQLKSEYERIALFHRERETFYLHLFQSLFLILGVSLAVLFSIDYSAGATYFHNFDLIFSKTMQLSPVTPDYFITITVSFFEVMSILFTMISFIIIQRVTKEINAVMDFDGYDATIKARILELSKDQQLQE